MERSFAHVCETGGGRRTWLRGRKNVSKRYQIQVAAHTLGVVMRVLFGVGKPGAERGCPEGTGANVCGSVPWEGTTRNKRTVWTVPTKPFSEAHFAT